MSDLYSPEFVQAAYPQVWAEYMECVESMDLAKSYYLTASAFRDWVRERSGIDGYDLPAGYESLEFLARAVAYRCIVCNEYKSATVELEDGDEAVDSWSSTLVCGLDCYSVIWRDCDVCNLSQRWGMPCVDADTPYHIELESANV